MDRHFEKTIHQGFDDGMLHHAITELCLIPSDNLMFRVLNPDEYASDDIHPRKLARSCYEAIAIMEAIIDTVPEKIADEAKRDVAEYHLDELGRDDDKPSSKLVGAIKIDPDSDEAREVIEMLDRLFGGDGE